MPEVIFIIGSGRCATTAISEGLALSPDVLSLSEPRPHLNEESRHKYEGFCINPFQKLSKVLGPRIYSAWDQGLHYIEKQNSLAPFIQELFQVYRARFIVPYRDARLTVQSLLKWHYCKYPIIYREAPNIIPFSEHATHVNEVVSRAGYDSFDYSLPRPNKHDPYFSDWSFMTRQAMCCWYWNKVYTTLLDSLELLPTTHYLLVDTTALDETGFQSILEFCSAGHVNSQDLGALLKGRPNENNATVAHSPSFLGEVPAWGPDEEDALDAICGITQARLGLSSSPRGKSADCTEKARLQRNPELKENTGRFVDCRHPRDVFSEWISQNERVKAIESIMEVGSAVNNNCGFLFAERPYVGVHIDPHVVETLSARNTNPLHRFICCDVGGNSDGDLQRADLVLCHGCIDHVSDINAFLKGLVARTDKILYISTYRGYFRNFTYHKVHYDRATGAFFNDLSPSAVITCLKQNGMQTCIAVPYKPNRSDTSEETAIIASRDSLAYEDLLGTFRVERVFFPYGAENGSITKAQLEYQVNSSCYYYSSPDMSIASPPSLFQEMLESIGAVNEQRDLRLEDFSPDGSAECKSLAVRVDVDDDLPAAAVMSEIASYRGYSLSFYLLPTAPYYGNWQGEKFVRNEVVAEYALKMQSEGHEIGLHVDPYFYYRELAIDGAEATLTELAWLRSRGINVCGVTGHNCASYNGAESTEIFREFQLSPRSTIRQNGLYAPLGVLSAQELGITYEGSFFCTTKGGCNPESDFADPDAKRFGYAASPSWMRSYLADNDYAIYGARKNIWITGNDSWITCLRTADGIHFWHSQTLDQVTRFLRLESRTPALVVLHPNYFGRRSSADQSPTP